MRQQFELLKGACSRYDSGEELEILNIATRLRVLLQGPTSLVGQLHLTRTLRFCDTSTHRLDRNRHPCIANLGVQIEMGVGARWIPLLDGWPDSHPRPPDAGFADWWADPILPRSTEGGLELTPFFSRRQLVLAVANCDGGAHVLARDADYDSLTRDSLSFEVAFRTEQGEGDYQPIRPNPTHACVRQIAHEVIKTLAVNLPSLLDPKHRS